MISQLQAPLKMEEIVLSCVERAPGATVKRISGFVDYMIYQNRYWKERNVSSWQLLPILRNLESEGKINIDRGRKVMRIWPVRREIQ